MTADREVLRTRLEAAIANEFCEHYGTTPPCKSCLLNARAALDAALALRSPCQTCGGAGERIIESLDSRKMDPYTIESVRPCDICNGSGCSPVPVVVEYLMERAGWVIDGDFDLVYHAEDDAAHARQLNLTTVPVWVYKESRDQ